MHDRAVNTLPHGERSGVEKNGSSVEMSSEVERVPLATLAWRSSVG